MTFSTMRQRALSVIVGCALVAALASAGGAGEVTLGGRTLRVADGFVIERIAGPPLIERPITAAFDDQGRLYVADSSGSNDNVQKQLAERPHRIVRLEDTDGDGTFDARTVFADKMMFPEGTLWHDGSLYVAAPPSIWKLTDTDGDGVADVRTEWFQGKTLTGCANDLHGPYAGPDGWIYWCKGAFARQSYQRPDKTQFVTRAAHIFRCRPDGTGVEPVMTGGMDNPVDLVFTPGGERIFTTTFFVHPGGGQRDGLVHAIYGGIYGKVHDPIFEPVHKWTGPEVMPVLLHMGPAAPCGLVRYESDAWGAAYEDNLFACYFNLHKVSRHVLEKSGATFTTRDEDLVSSPDIDFHPTDVIEDPVGGLVIVDTGGWYKLCCPTSQLHKPDVLGAVYRVTRRGQSLAGDLRNLKEVLANVGEPGTPAGVRGLANLLGDPRPVARRIARSALAANRQASLVVQALREAVASERSTRWRLEAVWTLARIENPQARLLVREFLSSPDETVRQAAIHATSIARDRDAVPHLVRLLESRSAHNRRAAAEALGRIGDPRAVPALLEAAGNNSDRIIDHSLIYALIEIADPGRIAAGLSNTKDKTIRSALVALDQMNWGRLDSRFVAALLASRDPELKLVAAWVIGRHREWAGALAGVLGERLDRSLLPAAERTELEHQLGRFAQSAPIQALLASRLVDSSAPLVARRSCLQAMASSELKANELPERWLSALAIVLNRDASAAPLVPLAVATVRALPLLRGRAGELAVCLLKIAGDPARPVDLRLAALAAIPGGLEQTDGPIFDLLLKALDRDQTVASRTTAADVLARARLTTTQLDRLVDALKSAGPLEVDRLLAAFEQSTDESLGLKLVQTLGDSPARSSLRPQALKDRIAKYGPSVKQAAEALYARLNVDLAKQKAHLDQLATALSTGDVRRGQLVFHGEKSGCFSCHAIGYRGGNVGPDLTKIGAVRTERDLLEAIVFPSASLVRSFEPIAVATSDGKTYNGLLRGETADEIVLATGINQEARIARREIDEIRPSTVSIMPAGLDQQLSPQELADLVAFLKACK
jgi:putative membrane-bound dehydrogenase-like protein